MLRCISCLTVVLFVGFALIPATVSAQPAPNSTGFIVSDSDIVGGILGAVAAQINPIQDALYASGANTFLVEMRYLDDPTCVDDTYVEIAVYNGVDLDGDPSDNYNGSEEFNIDPNSINFAGAPINLFRNGSVTAGFMQAGPGTLNLGFPIPDITLTGVIDPGCTGFISDPVPGFISVATFLAIPAPPPFSGTMVDALAFLGIFPDIDLDGDGIPAPPDIDPDDAYSADFQLTGVPAVIHHIPVTIEPSASFIVSDSDIVGGILGAVAAQINPIQDALYASGANTFLVEMFGSDDPDCQNEDAIEIAVYNGIDLDGDPSDNYNGSEEFEIDPNSHDDYCNAFNYFYNGSVVNGFMTAGPGTLNLGFPIPNVTLTGIIDPACGGFISDPVPGFISVATFLAIPAPPPFSGTMVDALAFLGIFPDIDLDGDGIPTPPDIDPDDAYSADFQLTGVPATIIHTCGGGTPPGTTFLRGDINSDGGRDIADGISGLGYLFQNQAEPGCLEAADTNDDGTVNIADIIFYLGYLFDSNITSLPEPFMACGIDPTPDPLSCLTSTGGCP